MTPISVSITAGTIEDADAFGHLVAATARQAGFSNVSTDIAAGQDYTEHTAAVEAMRNMNPDIFRTPVNISTSPYIAPIGDDEDDPEY